MAKRRKRRTAADRAATEAKFRNMVDAMLTKGENRLMAIRLEFHKWTGLGRRHETARLAEQLQARGYFIFGGRVWKNEAECNQAIQKGLPPDTQPMRTDVPAAPQDIPIPAVPPQRGFKRIVSAGSNPIVSAQPAKRDFVAELNAQRSQLARELRDNQTLDFQTRQRLANISEALHGIIIDLDTELAAR